MPDDFCWGAAIFGVAAGYFIRHKISRDGADRKEDRAKLDGISEDVGEAEELAYKYYSLPPDEKESQEISLQINRLMKKIGSETHQLSVSLSDITINQLHLGFKRKVTLNDYESSNRVPRDSSSPLFEEISDSARRLVGGMELAFRKKYRSHQTSHLGS